MFTEDFLRQVGSLMTLENIAQVIGVFAMVAICLSFVQRDKKTVLILQLIGSLLFAVNYFMRAAFAGGLLNVLGFIRAIVFLNKDKLKANHPAWTIGFTACYFLSYASVFLIFGKEPTFANFFFELLPVIAMVLSLISFRYSDAMHIRLFGLGSSPLWLTYNIASGSVGAIVCEVLNLCSITIGIMRYDINWKKAKKEKKGKK